MILVARAIFCGNEHGFGNEKYPKFIEMDDQELDQEFITSRNVKQLRADAKKAGWGRVNGEDYCPICMQSMSDE